MSKPGNPPDSTSATAEVPRQRDIDKATATAQPGAKLPKEATPPPPLPKGEIVGRYRIIEPLGEGGMGVVYVAHDPELDRRVALKLLRPEGIEGQGATEGRTRLVREAHAMAKLNHPNVVAIYDSGVYQDRVFLAVELVEGATVKEWLEAAPRSWQEIVGLFLKAGRGLAAAHAAGLIHRDFKPSNVLIGKTGEVKVADFGLARAAGLFNPSAISPERRAEAMGRLHLPSPGGELDASSDRVLSAPLTQAGVVTGTPGYMAPEQIMGFGDARTDEFSFCVALYRSLYGELPFEEQFNPLAPKQIKPPPKASRVPLWLRKVILRGLADDPNDRYPTLDELLARLADDPAVRRKRALAWAGLAGLVLASAAASAVFVVRQRAAADPCHDPAAKMTGVWDDAVKQQVQAAFLATGVPDAATTASFAEQAMDHASKAWLAAYADACQATRDRHEQPEAALNLRLDCLMDQRIDLQASRDIILHPDAKGLGSISGAASTLPLPFECADARSLSIIEPPPPEKGPQIAELRLALARGRALYGAGKYADAVEVLKPLPDKAHALGSRPLEARTLDALAFATSSVHRGKEESMKAIELHDRAAGLAEAARMDQLATSAAASSAWLEASIGRPAADVDASLERARGGLRRVGTGGIAEYNLERTEGFVETLRGHNADAATHGQRVLDLADKMYGPESIMSLNAANNLAFALEPMGQYDKMTTLLSRAVAGFDSILGPKNQRAIIPQNNLAQALLDLGRLDEASQALDKLFSRMSPDADRVELTLALAAKSDLQAARGQTADSMKTGDQAMAMGDRLHVLASPADSDLHRYLIEARLRDGQPKAALDEYEKYLAHQDLAPDSVSWVQYLRLGGWAYLDAGEPEKAVPVLQRALQLSASRPWYPGWVAEIRFHLAKALVASHGDRVQAEGLAKTAHDELAALTVKKDLLDNVDGWRATAFAPHH